VVLPTDPPYEVRFPQTTDYHWSLFLENATENIGGEPILSQGPFGFGKAVEFVESKSQCSVDDDFRNEDDICVQNPGNCESGFSLSLFYKHTFSVDPKDLEDDAGKFERKYILSTGGAPGYPGVGLFFSGPFLGAELSTGNETWSVIIKGVLPNNSTWNNIAIRWKRPVDNQAEFDAYVQNKQMDMVGGLEIFLNLEKVGHVIDSDLVCSCAAADAGGGGGADGDDDDTTECTQERMQCTFANTPKDSLSKPTVMLGCHKTSDSDSTYGNFLGGTFDELAIWRRHIMDNETSVFYGGFRDSLAGISSAALVNMMNGVDLSDPNQNAVALSVLDSVVGGETTTPEFRNIYPTQPTRPTPKVGGGQVEVTESTVTTTTATTTTTPTPITEEGAGGKDLLSLTGVLVRMTDPSNLPTNITEQDAKKKLKLGGLVGRVLNPQSQTGWGEVNKMNNEGGSHDLRVRLEAYEMMVSERVVLNDSVGFFASEIHSTNSFHQVLKETATQAIRSQFSFGTSTSFPKPSNVRRVRDKRQTQAPEQTSDSVFIVETAIDRWSEISESVEIPRAMFSGSCSSQDVSYVFNIYNEFPDPGWKNPVSLEARNIQLDSKVVSIAAKANSWDPTNQQFSESCLPDPKLLYSHKIMIYLTSKTETKSKRQLMFHEDEENPTILQRHCAIWNDDIGLFGAWDTDDIQTVDINEKFAVCKSEKLGTYAIVAEMIEQPYHREEMTWLYLVKIVGYFISIIALVAFIFIIQLSSYLWDQFHSLHLHFSLTLVLGHVCMLLTELDAIKDDRHLCTAIGCLIQIAYTGGAVFLAAETHACFKAITSGLVGGRASMYILMGWGLPLIILGYDILENLQDMGTDPMCMVGWDNYVKWHLFSPIICCAGISFVLMLIVMCNINNSMIRKSSLFEEISSVSYGLMVVVTLFSFTWSFGALAFIRQTDIQMPDFYPAFQVLNSWSGVTTLLLLGFCSTRFRAAIQGTTLTRKEQIMNQEAKEYM